MERCTQRTKRARISAFLIGASVFLFAPLAADAAQAGLFLNPATGTFLVGSTFDVSIVLDTKGVAVNTIEVELTFPADKLQVANPSVGSSIIQLWPAPPVFSNREGRIYFVGGIPSPGVVSSQGVVLTITFRVVSPGTGQVSFGERTRVLANDGRGTDVLGQRPPAFFTFVVPPPLGPPISSPTHPDQERWYRDTNPVFVWQRSQFADAYSFSLDRDPSGFPDTSPEGTAPTASFTSVENGIWYSHLRERAGDSWGGVSHFVVKIDSQPPAEFRLSVSPGQRTTNRNPVFRFFTTDALSGFDHFEMKTIPLARGAESEAFFFEVSSPYQALNMNPGRYQVIVRALDKAGNARDETLTMTIGGAFSQFITPEGIDFVIVFVPWAGFVGIIGMLLLIFILIFLTLWFRHRHHLQHAFREDFKGILRLLSRFRRGAPTAVLLLLLAIATFFFANSPGAGAGQLNTPGPLAPIISVAPPTYYPLDETLYLEGQSQPKANIDILFENPGVQPVRLGVISDSNGEWFFSGKLELASGEWTVRARVLGDPPSDWSIPRVIRSQVTGVVLGSIKVRYLPIVLVLSLMVVASAAFLVYSLLRVRTIQRLELERTTQEKTASLERALREKEREAAAEVVAENFSDLRRDIVDELTHLNEQSHGGSLSKEEENHREELLRELRRVEEAIEKKIKTIS